MKHFQAPEAIEVKGARVHNLKNVDVSVPLGKLVGICGVSGSGKSSLALGVLYAEGSRRYLEALSTYTRRRLSQPTEALVENVENVPAALALHQRPAVPSIRSTFGTTTELSNVLRLMFSRLGSHVCPNGHHVPPSPNVALMKPLQCPECGATFEGPGAESFAFNSDGACPRCTGTGFVREVDDRLLVSDENKTLQEGAVDAWNRFGISWMYLVAGELGVRTNVPFRELTTEEKKIIYEGEAVQRRVMIPSKNGKLFELNCTYRNAHRAIEEALHRAQSEKGVERIHKYLSVHTCPDCNGTRLNAKVRSSTLCGKTLPEVEAMTLDDLIDWIPTIPQRVPSELQQVAESIIGQFLRYSKRLKDLGLGYLSPNRAGNTLSTGERQRMQLAKAVRNRTTGVLYVLDEPSVGLHPKNVDGLTGVIEDLIAHGNSVVLVDHDTRILKRCDYLIEMGEGAGENGGNVLCVGSVPEIIASKKTRIGPFLATDKAFSARKRCNTDELFKNGLLHFETGEIYNVNPLRVDIPKGRLTAITGVSGSGKTTMLLESFIPAVRAVIAGEKLPEHVRCVQAEGIRRVHLIDASPIGANVRSTVATYSGVSDNLRKLFAATVDAKEKGLKSEDFTYNTGSLRCPTCDGTGQISMDVQFLPDVTVICPDCRGRRYGKNAEKVRYRGKDKTSNGVSIADCMSMTVQRALDVFSDVKDIENKLQTLSDLGLSYLTLGEATTMLSGGEAQRLKLAGEIGKTQNDAVFVFDEPSVGLHPLDVRVLIEIFQTLLDSNATVIVIEHDLDVIANADYVIDLDIDRNGRGGMVALGTPEEIRNNPKSVTGKYL